MVTSRVSVYNIASGQDLYVGVASSAYVPPVGQRANVNLNNASDVDYDLTSGVPLASRWWNGYQGAGSFGSMVGSYSGSIWASGYGSAGAFIVHGGGHGGQIGAFAYAFDFHTREWACIGAPGNVPATSHWCGYTDARDAGTQDLRADPASNIDQRDLQWLDYGYGGSYIKIADHEYLQNAYIPPSLGGGVKGSLYLPQSTYSQGNGVADPRTGGTGLPYLWAPHLMDLDTGVMTRAADSTLGAWASYSGAMSVVDTNRGRLWVFRNGSASCHWHDLVAGAPYDRNDHTMQTLSGAGAAWGMVANCTPVFVPEADCAVIFWPANQNSAPPAIPGAMLGIEVYDFSTGVPVDREIRATAPAEIAEPYGGLYVGVDWCPTLQRFYVYQGYGSDYCYTLTPSSMDFRTCSWTWGKEVFGGPAPVYKSDFVAGNAQADAVLGKWRWVAAYGCFGWHDGPSTTGECYDGVTRDGVVQLWRPPGTPVSL